ncbi:hypothetical protein AB3S75_010079 [Citrus x aurantiifolia]
MKEKNEKLYMEKYLEFFSSRKQSDLKVEFLNQIISMHGFKRLRLPKNALSEAVSTIDLMNPSRSTLKENISPAMSLTLKQVTEDLNDLTWQECCVTSIKVLNSRQAQGTEDINHNNDNNIKAFSVASKVSTSKHDVPVSAYTTSLYAGFDVGAKPKKKRSNKLAPTSSLYGAAGADEIGDEKANELVPKRKRSKRVGVTFSLA